MSPETQRRCLSLQSLPGLPGRALCDLLRHCGGVDALWHSEPAQWPALGLAPSVIAAFHRLREGRGGDPRVDIEAQLALLQEAAVQVLCIADADYPPLLGIIADPPPVLYLRGQADVLWRPQLAVVGSRRASGPGLRAAHDLSAAAAAAGLVITSGLAQGIDGAAHRGALAGGGASVGVMATGIEQVYPRRHRDLAGALLEAGCLVTELPPGCGPRREHFPRRNRVISGLSLGVLVVEAALPSGSLITAGTALAQHREVFALPWSIHHPGGRGCLQLLRDGAALVQDVGDLFAELESLAGLQRALSLPDGPPSPAPARDPGRDRLLALIGDGSVTVDELAHHSQWPLAQVAASLSQLEWEGLVQRVPGGYTRA
jgi:DNA processing protein